MFASGPVALQGRYEDGDGRFREDVLGDLGIVARCGERCAPAGPEGGNGRCIFVAGLTVSLVVGGCYQPNGQVRRWVSAFREPNTRLRLFAAEGGNDGRCPRFTGVVLRECMAFSNVCPRCELSGCFVRRKESWLLGLRYEHESVQMHRTGPYISEGWLWSQDPPDHRSAGGLRLASQILAHHHVRDRRLGHLLISLLTIYYYKMQKRNKLMSADKAVACSSSGEVVVPCCMSDYP